MTGTYSGLKVPRYHPDHSGHVRAVSLSSTASTSSTSSDVPIVPPAAYHSAQQVQADQLADFFGDSRKSRTRDVLPPYPSDGDLPTYDTNAEPATLARFMFIYGFMFPPFWIMGIIILASKLHPPADWDMEKPEEEKVRLLAEMRTAEVKWAKRCVYALLTFITVISIIVVSIVLVKRRTST